MIRGMPETPYALRIPGNQGDQNMQTGQHKTLRLIVIGIGLGMMTSPIVAQDPQPSEQPLDEVRRRYEDARAQFEAAREEARAAAQEVIRPDSRPDRGARAQRAPRDV